MVEMLATFLDVGQGDSTVTVFPGGGGMLVDCPAGSAPIVVDYLERAQITRLELVVITHSDLDHAGGVVDVIKGFQGPTLRIAELIDRVRPSDQHANMKYRLMLRDLAQFMRDGIAAFAPYAGTLIEFGDVEIDVLHPSEADRLDALSHNDRNNCSIALRLEYAGARVLLAADLQQRGWQWIMERHADLKADVLKFPHHGAWYDGDPTLGKVLELVDPSLVVISVGSTNGYHHPAIETFKLLRALGNKVRFVCTQATDQCHSEPEVVAVQARELLPMDSRGGHSFANSRSCPCAGNVTVRISDDGIVMGPTREQHDRVIDLFETPQCR